MESIVRSFSEHGTFVQPETLNYILSKDNPKEFVSSITERLIDYPLVLTIEQIKQLEQEILDSLQSKKCEELSSEDAGKNSLLDAIYGDEQILERQNNEDENDDENLENGSDLQISEQDHDAESRIILTRNSTWKPLSAEHDAEIKIFKDITGNSTCEGNTSDFTKLFLNRFDILRKILKSQRREMANVIPINRIKKSGIKEIQIVGIIKDIRNTKNGHKFIEIEDETGCASAIVIKDNREVFSLAGEIIIDEILGMKCTLSKDGDLLVVQNIVFPDISIQNERRKSEIPLCAAFASDIHIGSKQFLQDQWETFIRWLNGNMGNSRQKAVAGKIKYLVIPGDVVDGIGIYPNQEKELSITDVYRQYEVLAEQLQLVPDYVSIIMQPGNHDAVRPAEPQPTFEKEIQDLFSGKNITFIGNPCYFSLHGVEILSYHGQSLLDFATNIQCLKYNEPVEIMKTMLKKHHLAPAYGGYTPLAPEHTDYMVIDKIPDIFVTGHVHLAKIGEYRGVTLINSSSWQAQTSYQKMLNFMPDPAKLPIANLKNGNVTMMDFSK